MNYCQKEEFLSKLVQEIVINVFYGTRESTPFSNIRETVKRKCTVDLTSKPQLQNGFKGS